MILLMFHRSVCVIIPPPHKLTAVNRDVNTVISDQRSRFTATSISDYTTPDTVAKHRHSLRQTQSPALSPITHSSSSSSPSSLSPLASFWTQDLALQQILSSIDLFFFHRTDYTDYRTMLNRCTGKCIRLSRPLVGFWTHFKSPHFHFISFHWRRKYKYTGQATGQRYHQ